MTFMKQRNENSEALKELKLMLLLLVDWDSVTKLEDFNAAYIRDFKI